MHDVAERNRRIFAGITLDDEARTACATVAHELRDGGFAARYEAPEKLHLTLAFLGFAAPPQVEAAALALDVVAAVTAPFVLRLDKLGAFPHERKARVVYIGARAPGDAFRALAARIRGAYEALGFTFPHDAVAHVTIARAKPPFQPLRACEFAPIAASVGGVALLESKADPERNTSRYEIVRRVSFSAG